jgi:hypothetical protein
MSASTRLPTIAALISTAAALVGISSMPAVRDFLSRHLGSNGTKYAWRTLALIFALLNLKNIPGFWHIRVLRAIFYQMHLQPTRQKPKHLFAPLITSSFNTLYDCDYNFHKSNSTYFADLDVARANLMGNIIQTGVQRLNKGDEEGLPKEVIATKGTYSIALGGVSCFFQRQIEPLQQFEIYTRVLAWDRKWIYLVSHVVKKGAIKPESYALQPWKKGKRRAAETTGEDDLTKHIFATSVARYVFKKGRLTINPEIILERSHLLPTRPAGVGLPPREESVAPTPAGNGTTAFTESVAAEVSSKLDQVVEEAPSQDGDWTWDDMERERLRGLKIASHFDALSAAHGELRGGEVLGQYGDYW